MVDSGEWNDTMETSSSRLSHVYFTHKPLNARLAAHQLLIGDFHGRVSRGQLHACNYLNANLHASLKGKPISCST